MTYTLDVLFLVSSNNLLWRHSFLTNGDGGAGDGGETKWVLLLLFRFPLEKRQKNFVQKYAPHIHMMSNK